MVAESRFAVIGTLSRALATMLLALAPAFVASAGDPDPAPQAEWDLTTLSVEELADLEVVTASKKPQKRSEVPAAVAVITGEEIRRSGATRLPEALRLVPGVHVARIDSSRWAMGIRGFTSSLSRSMLVLIDGRGVYTPLYAGVYWQVQDTLLEDVDRIEVIRGPGGSLWGANAVTGVVNIITKSAERTHGGFADAIVGSEERSVAMRYGGPAGEAGSYRAYAKYSDRDDAFHPDGNDYDDWRMGQVGFRSDWTPREGDQVTVQGDAYGGKAGSRVTFAKYEAPFSETVERDSDLAGGNLLARWRRQMPRGSDLAVQFYYDRTERHDVNFREDRNTFDLDVQHRIETAGRQELVYGMGYRHSAGRTGGVPTVAFEPARRGDDLFTAFLQDEIRLRPDRMHLVLGSKFEHNDYSGFEAQPSVRLLWMPSPRQTFWSAISRAVRTPSRLEHDLELTALMFTDPRLTFARVLGNRGFEAERFLVYEAGYRAQASSRVSVDAAAFYTDASNLLSLERGALFQEPEPPPEHDVLPFTFDNRLRGRIHGAEISTDTLPLPWWRLSGSYSYLRMDLEPHQGSTDTTSAAAERASPRHMVVLHSSMSLPRDVHLDLVYRFVDRLPSQNVDRYSGLDLRLAWRRGRHWELALAGQNLFQDHHAEFGGGVEVERAVYLDVTRRW